MESNYSRYTTPLTMESLNIPPSYIVPAFILATLTYLAIMLFNLTMLLAIALNQKLHTPMYILLFNMPLNDMLGATAFFPQLVSDILTENRSIYYSACFAQALTAHLYGAGSFLILTVMAYDRYVAICYPLRYNTLLSPNNLIKIMIVMWASDFILIGMLLALNYLKDICSTKIVDIFCNNPCLMKLSCGDAKVNNYYGLFITFFFQGLSLLVIFYTYIQILITCFHKRQSNAKSKAIQTCGTHLIVFLCLELTLIFSVLAHRFEEASPYLRKALGASVMIFPPFINPLIYGLKTKEIRQTLAVSLNKKISLTKRKAKVCQGTTINNMK